MRRPGSDRVDPREAPGSRPMPDSVRLGSIGTGRSEVWYQASGKRLGFQEMEAARPRLEVASCPRLKEKK
jgi:hypothetical protein